ncbi:MAG: indolepyruvate oxidoreductase subunit beta [Phycisphaerae bacterium]
MSNKVTNVVFAGLGGQGVLKASDILSDAAFHAGLDVKKAEIHGMSQRGGSVTSDVRFGRDVLSPMVPAGKADYLVVLSADQVDNNMHHLSESGTLVGPGSVDPSDLPNKRSFNIAMLGALSVHLDIDDECFRKAIAVNLPEKTHEVNFEAFEIGKNAVKK